MVESIESRIVRWERRAVSSGIVTVGIMAMCCAAVVVARFTFFDFLKPDYWTVALSIIVMATMLYLGYLKKSGRRVGERISAINTQLEAKVQEALTLATDALGLKAERFRVVVSAWKRRSRPDDLDDTAVAPALLGRHWINIHRRTVRRCDLDQLRSTIGHEIGHTNRALTVIHWVTFTLTMIGMLATVSIAFQPEEPEGTPKDGRYLFAITVLGSIVLGLLSQMWSSRWAERYCDMVGIKAGSARGSITGLQIDIALSERVEKRMNEGKFTYVLKGLRFPTWLSTHPATPERIQYMQEFTD